PDGWVPEQKISVAEAVRAYTFGSAYAEGQETVKGTLEPGRLADLVVLSDDIFSIDPVGIADARVDLTLLGGRVVFDRAARTGDSPAGPAPAWVARPSGRRQRQPAHRLDLAQHEALVHVLDA